MQRAGINFQFHIGEFLRDLTATGTGTLAITGVGFQPRFVIVFTSRTNTPASSWGLDDAVAHQCIYQQFSNNTQPHNTMSAIAQTGGGPDWQYGYIQSMDIDGFTYNFTEGGNPTGFWYFKYIAIR